VRPPGRESRRLPLFSPIALLAALALAGCRGSGSAAGLGYSPAGSFAVQGINVQEGTIWQLNRAIRIEFNHPVDPLTLNFGSVRIRGLTGLASQTPVTGTFEIAAEDQGRVVIFRPNCPRSDTLDDGGLLPGGFDYEVSVATSGESAIALRDSAGRPLERGIRRTFRTPSPPAEPLFLDESPAPPILLQTRFPVGLNLLSVPDPVVELVFDQSIDPRSTNLNLDEIALYYADGVAGTAGESDFPPENRVPGRLVLLDNCGVGGATVHYLITGVLPPGRRLRLVVKNTFSDLVGQSNVGDQMPPDHLTPTLAEFYADPSFGAAELTADEFRDGFEQSAWLDLEEPLPLPNALWQPGSVSGALVFPGIFVAEDQDLILLAGVSELNTDGVLTFTDDEGRPHVNNQGVLNVDDVRIEAGATLRCIGRNPLVIYATGDVVINGLLDVSGFNAIWPSSLNSPQFTEGGAAGVCGGGQGGDSSWANVTETPRGETGDGPFSITHGGGQGGEGSWQDADASALNTQGLMRIMAAGGGGGGFARTLNHSILFNQWPLEWRPTSVDDAGPDHDAVKHPRWNIVWNPDTDSPAYGAEDGRRAPSIDNTAPPTNPGSTGLYGMEDLAVDTVPAPETSGANLDPAWTSGDVPPYNYGHPTFGPDGGRAGPPIFVRDDDLFDDFWGIRLAADGSTVRGELLAPWAGAGGGGGGDSCLIERGTAPTLREVLPLRPFNKSPGAGSSGWTDYHKGAGGGGGGGQLLVFALGDIEVGAAARVKANGGYGWSGNSLTGVNWTISGSGAGAGGHVVLHTNSRLDLSAIAIGSASNASQIGNLTAANVVQSFGGRRGWAAPILNNNDGNDDFMASRGGAGGNGVIQIHVADPDRDIVWPPAAANGIRDYLGDPVDPDRLEEILALFARPNPFALIPFFHSRTMVQSRWIDSGLAGLRTSADPDPAAWDFPRFADALLGFGGQDLTTGRILATNGRVIPLHTVATGATTAATFGSYEMVVPGATAFFAPLWLRNPALLIGYDLLPDAGGSLTFEVVGAAYDRDADVLRLQSRLADGPLVFALNAENPVWSVRAKFLRLEAAGVKDSVPSNVEVRIEFQGARPEAAGSNLPGTPLPGVNEWTSDFAALDGCRFFRWRAILDSDAQRTGYLPTAPQPSLDYLKIPFVW